MTTLTLHVALERPGFTLDVNLGLPLTGITALFGPSGSGKTTLLRIIAGLERGAQGTVAFDGRAWQGRGAYLPTHLRRVGYVFQDGRLFRHLTVEQNLKFGIERGPRDPTAPALDFAATVAALDLEPLLRRRTPSLSGGEQQRVAIARALLARPRLLLMDEPLSSLDAARKREIVPHIENLPQRFGVPVIYVTHNVDEVLRLASDVALMAAGRIVAHGGVSEIFGHLDLGTLGGGFETGSMLEGTVVAHASGVATLRVGAQELRVPMAAAAVGTVRRVRIDARDVAIATLRPQQLSIRNVLVARILSIESGANENVDVKLDVDGEHLRSRITRDALAELGLAPGREVFALIKSVALESSLGP